MSAMSARVNAPSGSCLGSHAILAEPNPDDSLMAGTATVNFYMTGLAG